MAIVGYLNLDSGIIRAFVEVYSPDLVSGINKPTQTKEMKLLPNPTYE